MRQPSLAALGQPSRGPPRCPSHPVEQKTQPLLPGLPPLKWFLGSQEPHSHRWRGLTYQRPLTHSRAESAPGLWLLSKAPGLSPRMSVACKDQCGTHRHTSTNVHIRPLVGELQPVSLTHLTIIPSPRTSSGSQEPRVPRSLPVTTWPGPTLPSCSLIPPSTPSLQPGWFPRWTWSSFTFSTQKFSSVCTCS